MPWRPSVSTSNTWRPSAARASARAAATVVFPVPPFPVTTWQRTEEGTGLTDTSLEGPPAPHRSQARVGTLQGAAVPLTPRRLGRGPPAPHRSQARVGTLQGAAVPLTPRRLGRGPP